MINAKRNLAEVCDKACELDMQKQPKLPREFMDAVAALAGGNQ